MSKAISFFSFLFCFPFLVIGQEKLSPDEMHERRYQKRIKQEYLDGVYIPKDLADVFAQLNELTDPKSKVKFKGMTEENARTKLHFSLGRWITRNWGFYEGSRLSHYLKGLGITYPDDMATFLIVCYHRYLNKHALDIKNLAKEIRESRKQMWLEEMREEEILHKETRKKQPDDQNR